MTAAGTITGGYECWIYVVVPKLCGAGRDIVSLAAWLMSFGDIRFVELAIALDGKRVEDGVVR